MAVAVDELILMGAIGLVAIGIIGMMLSRHLFRVLLALAIAEAGANLLLVLTGFRWNAAAPILLDSVAQPVSMVDPVPQALVLTSIVIGVGVQALAVALLIRIYQGYGTLDRHELAAMLDKDLNKQAGVEPERSPDAPVGKQPFPVPEKTEAGV